MLKKTITYTDYDGTERTEDHYFNFSKAEITEMELTRDGGMAAYITKITAAKRGSEIMRLMKDVILKAYGIKSDDGRRFIKSEEISKEFSETEAYSQIFMELVTDAEKAAAFVNGIVPASLSDKNEEGKNVNAKNN